MIEDQTPTDATPLRDTEFKQKRNGNQTRFHFGEDELAYTVTDKSGSTSFQVKYQEISRIRDFLVERNSWLQNVGVLWIALGVVLTVVNFATDRQVMSIWLPVGIACVLFARFRTTRYTKIPTDHGTIFIIDDDEKDRILDTLESRRLNQLRRWYDFLSPDEDPARQRKRYQWLQKEGALTDADLTQRLAALDIQFGDELITQISGETLADESGGTRRLLN
ncbi:MAG: hypothetical protein SGI99_17690 [Pseudomonadota bacterium]|nr:hypothetical protein [Pseudomonadota bacterium]